MGVKCLGNQEFCLGLKSIGLRNKVDTELSAGRRPTSGLFIQRGGDTYNLEVFYESFLENSDPTGYLCALEVLTEVEKQDRWEEWCRLLGNSWFSFQVERWQHELEVRARANACQAIITGCDPKDFARLRYVAEGKVHNNVKAGRPSQQAQKKEEATKHEITRLNPDAAKILGMN